MGVPSNFAVTAAPGGYLASWTNDSSLNSSNVLSMSLVYTTTEANASFQTIVLEPTVVNGSVINQHLLVNFPAGFIYQMSLQIASTDDNLSGASNVVEFAVVSVPSKPVFRVTAGDQLLFFSLLNASQLPITLADVGTLFDGFEDLNKIEISLSDKTVKLATNIALLADASNNFYRNGGFTLDASLFNNMQNDHTYAVALTYYNSIGKSVISDTKFFTPSQLPIDMDTAAVETINVNKNGFGATIFWNAPSNALTGIQSISKVTSYSVWRAVVTNGVAGTASRILTDKAVDASGNNSDIQARDASLNYIASVFDSVSYKYIFNDTTAQNGTKYRYYLTAKNEYGSSTIKDSSSYADVLVGGLPLAPVVTSTPGDKQLKLKVDTTNGKLNGLTSTGKVYVKLYASSQMGLSDASQNALHGYNWSEMTLDASSCVTLVGVSSDLNNGTRYGASVKIETQSNVLAASKYVSAAGALANHSSPYKAPAVPTGLAISPLDASGNPLNGKLNLSWNAQTYLAVNGFGPDASVNFVITRHEGLDGSGNEINSVELSPSPANSRQDTGLVNDKVYYYALKAMVPNAELARNIESSESTPEVVAAPFSKPASVTGLAADCSGNADIFVDWTNIADASANYQLKISRGNVVVSIYPVTSRVILTNALNNFVLGAEYTIEVRSVISRIGQLFYSDAATTATIPFLTPGAVQDLQLSVSSQQVFAVWEKPLNMDASGVVSGVKITSYDVSVFNQFGVQVGNTINTSALYQLVSGLSNNTSYTMRVTAKGNAGSSGSGKVVSGSNANSTLFLVNAGPAAPVLLTSEASDKTIKLNWVHPDASVTSFKVFQDYILLNEPTPALVNEGVYNSGGIVGFKWSTIISGLTNGQTYRFEVIASKQSIDSVQDAAFTNATPYKAPSAPNANAIPFEVGNNEIALNWAVPTDNGGASSLLYKVELFDTSNNSLSDASANLVGGYPQDNISSLSLSDNSRVLNGKTYYAKVFAYYSINGAAPTSTALRIPASGSIKVNEAPSDVTNLAATPADRSVRLTWTDPSGSVNYPYTTTIVQKLMGSVWTQIASLPRVGAFTDSNLNNGQSYSYRVIAQHSNSSAQQPSGAFINSIPAGAPIFEVNNQFNNVTHINNLDFKLRYNRNGSVVTSATLIGIDFNGVARVVANANLGNQMALQAATFNGQPCLASETFEWTLPRIDGNNRIKDLLFILTNSAGSKVVSWPIPPNAFDK